MRDHAAESFRDLFCWVFCGCHRTRPKPSVRRSFAINAYTFTCEGESAMLTVKDTEVPGTCTVSISFVDAKGKPAKVDGVPTWSVDDATIVDSVTPAADGLSAVLHITDTTGATNLTVDADADLGSGVTDVIVVDTISVIPGDAVAGNLTFGAVTPD